MVHIRKGPINKINYLLGHHVESFGTLVECVGVESSTIAKQGKRAAYSMEIDYNEATPSSSPAALICDAAIFFFFF